jgi:hypothetical protein
MNIHGNARLAERKIRLWILQQELNRRREGPPAGLNVQADPPVQRR